MDTWVQGPATQCLNKLNICIPQPSLAAELCRLLPVLPVGHVRRRKTSGAKGRLRPAGSPALRNTRSINCQSTRCLFLFNNKKTFVSFLYFCFCRPNSLCS